MIQVKKKKEKTGMPQFKFAPKEKPKPGVKLPAPNLDTTDEPDAKKQKTGYDNDDGSGGGEEEDSDGGGSGGGGLGGLLGDYGDSSGSEDDGEKSESDGDGDGNGDEGSGKAKSFF